MSKQIIICQQGKYITLWCLNKYGNCVSSFQPTSKQKCKYIFVPDLGWILLILSIGGYRALMDGWLKADKR